MSRKLMHRVLGGLLVSTSLVQFVGCYQEPPVAFEKNLLFAYRVSKDTGRPVDKTLAQTTAALTDLFGTPEKPVIPKAIAEDGDLKEVLSLERLQKAAGPANKEANTGLFQLHLCTQCHGITGEGRGLAAALSDVSQPYPRDYRKGVFKFKSTPRGEKPTRADLGRVIKHGIAGTPMKPLEKVGDDDIEALVDYVIYLSMRGEVERALLTDSKELGEDEPIYDPTFKDEEGKSTFDEQVGYINDHITEIAGKWLDAADKVIEVKVPEQPPMIAAGTNLNDPEIAASIERGKKVFLGPVGACFKCHGAEGKGDGQTNDYDDWTKEWTVQANVQPTDAKALVPYIARGALPPRNIRPRNFREGLFRGGNTPEDLYRRIIQGIDGTPMPAATMKVEGAEVGLTEQDVWDLVNFVRSMSQS